MLKLWDYTVVPMIGDECQDKLGNIRIKKLLGSGAYASIYEACDNEVCDMIVKIIDLSPVPYPYDKRPAEIQVNEYITKFNIEVEINRRLSKVNVSPKLIDAFICIHAIISTTGKKANLGLIVSERWDMDLIFYLNSEQKPLPEHIINLLEDKIRIMHENGIRHDDLHKGNIVLKVNRTVLSTGREILEPLDIAIIDFGSSKIIGSPVRYRSEFSIIEELRNRLEDNY